MLPGTGTCAGDRPRPLVVEDDRVGGIGQVSLEIGALRSADALRRPPPAVQPADAGSVPDPGRGDLGAARQQFLQAREQALAGDRVREVDARTGSFIATRILFASSRALSAWTVRRRAKERVTASAVARVAARSRRIANAARTKMTSKTAATSDLARTIPTLRPGHHTPAARWSRAAKAGHPGDGPSCDPVPDQKPITPVIQSRMTTMPGTPRNQSKSGMAGDSNVGSRVAPVPPWAACRGRTGVWS